MKVHLYTLKVRMYIYMITRRKINSGCLVIHKENAALSKIYKA